MTVWSSFLLGLVTSVHCVAMCGALVFTYSAADRTEGSVGARLVPHLLYQGAKIVSYMAVALVLGAIAQAVGGVPVLDGVRRWVMFLAGTGMVLIGLSMTGRFAVLSRALPRPPRWLVSAMSRARSRATADRGEGRRSYLVPVTFGLLTGLMPCAPLIAAQMGALSAGSAIGSAGLMAAFGLGTAPLMLGMGLVASSIEPALRRKLNVAAAIAVIIFGLVVADRGLVLLGSPVSSKAIVSAVRGDAGDATSGVVAGDGVVEVPITIRNTRFIPSQISIPAGVRTRLIVTREEDVGCSDELAVPAAGVLAALAPFAVTVVELPPMEAGRYVLTCGMGMMDGTLYVE